MIFFFLAQIILKLNHKGPSLFKYIDIYIYTHTQILKGMYLLIHFGNEGKSIMLFYFEGLSSGLR